MEDFLSTTPVMDLLRDEGFEFTYSSLKHFVREKYVTPTMVGGIWLWTPEDIDDLRTQLTKRNRGPKGFFENLYIKETK